MQPTTTRISAMLFRLEFICSWCCCRVNNNTIHVSLPLLFAIVVWINRPQHTSPHLSDPPDRYRYSGDLLWWAKTLSGFQLYGDYACDKTCSTATESLNLITKAQKLKTENWKLSIAYSRVSVRNVFSRIRE